MTCLFFLGRGASLAGIDALVDGLNWRRPQEPLWQLSTDAILGCSSGLFLLRVGLCVLMMKEELCSWVDGVNYRKASRDRNRNRRRIWESIPAGSDRPSNRPAFSPRRDDSRTISCLCHATGGPVRCAGKRKRALRRHGIRPSVFTLSIPWPAISMLICK